MILFGEIPL